MKLYLFLKHFKSEEVVSQRMEVQEREKWEKEVEQLLRKNREKLEMEFRQRIFFEDMEKAMERAKERGSELMSRHTEVILSENEQKNQQRQEMEAARKRQEELNRRRQELEKEHTNFEKTLRADWIIYRRGGYGIKRNQCQSGEAYSNTLKKCISKFNRMISF